MQKQGIKYVWLIIVAILSLLRLFLTGDRDILALNSPHDEYWYIHTALNGIWGGSYNHMSFMHLQTYSVWLALLHLFGISVRFAIDVSWVLATAYLAFAIHCLTKRSWLAVLIFAFLIYHPYSLIIFDRALAETFLTVASVVVIGAGIEIWNCRNNQSIYRRRAAIVIYSLSFAIAFHTRKEGVVLMVPLLLLACWSLFDREYWWSRLGKKKLILPFLFSPLVATLVMGLILAGGNYLKWGVWARYELAATGYQSAIGALNKIDVGRTPKHITVTKQVLSLAYRESPTFRELSQFIEGPTGQQWVAIAEPFTSVSGEIGNGWFYWALRDVAAEAGWHRDAKVAERKYTAVADELENAFASGQLNEKVLNVSPFIDPDISKWMPEVPISIYKLLRLMILPQLGDIPLPTENATESQFEQYVSITGRRMLQTRCKVAGWVLAQADTLIGLGTKDITYSWVRLGDVQRRDVSGAYPFSVSSLSIDPPTEIHLLSRDGKKGNIALTDLKVGMTSTITGDIQTDIGIDSMEFNLKQKRADKWLALLCIGYEKLGYMFVFITIVGVFSGYVKRNRSPVVLILLLMITTIAARIILFAVLDASAWSGIQSRYILPIIPAFACMTVLGFELLCSTWSKDKA